MMSFAFGTLRLEETYIEDKPFTSKTALMPPSFHKRNNVHSYISKQRDPSIRKELEKYGNVSEDLVERLSNVVSMNEINTRMLVAADYWFRSNGKPKIFTPEMFTMSNPSFAEISTVLYGDKKAFDKDSLITIISYASYLRKYVYPIYSDIPLVYDDIDEYDVDYSNDVHMEDDD